MPLDRQSRINRHIKASRPQVSNGAPGISEGVNGDVTYRQVGGSLSQYVKKDNKWHEISGGATETQIITVAGGGTTTAAGGGVSDHDELNNLTSGDDHTQYVHNTTARTITAQHNFTNATVPFSVTSTNKVTNLNAERINSKSSTDLVLVDGSQALSANWDAGAYQIRALTFQSDVSGSPPFVVASSNKVVNLNADQLDGNDESAFFKLADSETVTGIPAFNGGTSGASAPFTVDSTDKVANLNADLLDGFDESAFFKLADNETVTGVPAFNGGTSGSSSPFSVDSTYKVSNLNADLLDGYDETAFFLLADDETVTGQPSFNGGDGSSPPFYVDSGYVVADLNADKADGYHFDQDVRTTASPAFVGLTVGAGNIDSNSSMTITGDITGDSGNLTVSASSGDVLVEGTTFSGNNVSIPGDLTVLGDSVTLTTATVQVEDKNIYLAYNNTTGDDAAKNTAANAGGVSLKAAEDKHFVWYNTTDRWTASEDIEAPGLYLNTNTETKITLHDTAGPTDVTIGTSNAGDMILTAVSGQGVTVDNNNHLGGTSFFSGFAGSGWRITKDAANEYNAEFDNLVVRGTMSVYELLIQQIRATNGSIMVTSADKVIEISDEGGGIYKFTIEADDTDDFIHFTEDDLIIAQKWAGTSGEPPYTPIKRVRATVTETSNSDGSSLTGQEFLVDLYDTDTISSADLPMDFVRIGNTSDLDRQGGIYLTSEDSGAPFIDIFNDVASWPDWRDTDKTKARLGKLDGITHNGTNLNSYGLFSDRVYLTGNITATSGYIGSTDEGWTIASDQIHNGNFKLNANDETLQLGTVTSFANDTNTKQGIYMGKDGGNYEFFAGKEATEYVWWDGDNLNVKGIITVTSGSNVEAGADVTDYTVNNTDANLTTGTTIDAGGVYIAGTAGKFTVSKTSNTIDYDAADAVFLGVHGSTGNEKPKLSLKGGASDGYLKWDGADLSIKGSITITGWSDPSDESGVGAAQTAADDAQDDADAAAGAASDAQDDADEAKSDLSDIADDGKVTPDEKLSAKVLYDKIINEYSGIIAQALAQGVSSTAYTTDYDALVLYIGTTISVFSSMSATTDITRSDWTTKWGDYYTEKQTLLNAIVADAESKADAAQSDADAAQGAAEAAAGTAAARATTFRQNDVPDANAIGDIWYDTNDGNKMYVSASATADSIDPGEWELFSPSLAVLTYDAPEGEGSGLYMDDTHLGYYTDSGSYDDSNWKTYMQSNGNFYLDGAGGGLSWVAASSTLIIQGDITADDGYIGTTTGWHINSGNIENGKVKLDAANELIKVGFVDNFTISGTDSGILMGKESGSGAGTNYDFFAGKKDAQYIHWDASEGRLIVKGEILVQGGSTGVGDVTNTILQNGTTISGGGVFMDDGGKITIGATNDIDYGDASSIFIGYDSGYKMSLKGAGSEYLTWDGSTLTVSGQITMQNQGSIDQTAFLNSAASGADVTLAAIEGELAVTGGGIVMTSTAKIRAGQTAYDTGDGFWLGGNGKFSIGDSSDDKLTWNGSTLSVKGQITMDGGSIAWSSVTNTGTVPYDTSGSAAGVQSNLEGWEYGDLASGNPPLTYIDSGGIYTGTLTAGQIQTIGFGFSANKNYNFFESTHGFLVDSGVFSQGEQYATLYENGSDARIRTATFDPIDGKKNQYIKIKFRRQAGTGWDGKVYWIGDAGSYGVGGYKSIPETGQTVATSTWTTVVLDMWDLTSGGAEWKDDDVITNVRFDFGNSSSDEFDIEYISIGNFTDSPGTFIDAHGIYTGTLNADNINSGTITGRTLQTSSSGQRIIIHEDDKLEFYDDSNLIVQIEAEGSDPSIRMLNSGNLYISKNSNTSGIGSPDVSHTRYGADGFRVTNRMDNPLVGSDTACVIQGIGDGTSDNMTALNLTCAQSGSGEAIALDISAGTFINESIGYTWFGSNAREIGYGNEGGVVNFRSHSGDDYHDTNGSGDGQAIRIWKEGTSTSYWSMWVDDGYDLHFREPDGSGGELSNSSDVGNITFTGQHRCKGNSGMTTADYAALEGYIVSSSGVYDQLSGGEIRIDEALPVIELSDSDDDKTVFGVVSGREGDIRSHQSGQWVTSWGDLSGEDERIMINSLGEGCIWVTNINGNLDNGDYITSSTAAGLGQKQNDDLLHNYTVAKITQDCDFSSGEEFEHDGVTYKKQFVGCTYHCG